jgi:hypothetical protein
MAVHDYDISLRHAAVRKGEWVGYRLAWKDLGGLDGVVQPHERRQLWDMDGVNPATPRLGKAGDIVWTLWLALHKELIGLQGRPPADGETKPSDMLGWLREYLVLPALQLQDVDGGIYTVVIYGYEEKCIEPYDPAHDGDGGWLVRLDLAHSPAPL